MKTRILTVVFAFFISLGVFAQSSGFKYQAVVRNAEGEIQPNTNVDFKFSITQGDAFTLVYSETQSTSTNDYGLVSLNVGDGAILSGDFETIDWSADSHALDIEIDFNDGNGYQNLGSTPLLPVPYAMHANSADMVVNDMVDDADADPNNEIQDLQLDGNILSITGNPDATALDLSPFGGTNTDEQTLNLVGNTLNISNGNSVDLSIFMDDTDTQLSEAEVDAFVANNGYLTAEGDADDTNELQSLNLVGNTLSISDGNDVSLDISDNDWTINDTKLQSVKDTVKVGANTSVDASLQIGAGINANIHMGGNSNRYADIDFDYTASMLKLSAMGFLPSVVFDFDGNTVMTVSSANKVSVDGTIQMTDGNQGIGKVLTSDNSGNASWQEIPEPELKYYSVDQMSFGDGAIETNVNSTYVKLKDIGTFTKVHEDTDVEIEFNGLLAATNLIGTYVKFQIRVDDNYTNSTGFGEFTLLSHLVNGNRYYERFNSFWETLSAGDHTISIWIRTSPSGSADDVSMNLGNFGAYFVIKEYTND